MKNKNHLILFGFELLFLANVEQKNRNKGNGINTHSKILIHAKLNREKENLMQVTRD